MTIWDLLWRRTPAAPASDAVEPKPTGLPALGAPLLALSAMDPAARRAALLSAVINPTLAWLGVRGIPASDKARVMLLAIAGQEADCRHRAQIPVAHAMGLWQFERGGGVAGVLAHKASMTKAAALCAIRGVEPSASAVHSALRSDDVLAAGFARLLLWTDARPLPGDEGAGWDCYLRNWRPGKPHPQAWGLNWRLAREAVTE